MDNFKVSYFIDPNYGHFQNIISSTINQILEIAGNIPNRTYDSSKADLIYSHNIENNSFHASELSIWENIHKANPKLKNQVFLPDLSFKGNKVDWILCTYFFISGIIENEKNVNNEFNPPTFLIKKWGLSESSTVDICVSKIKNYLISKKPELRFKRRWPNGKTWAFVMSHDCDRLELYRPIDYFKDALKNIFAKKYKSSLGLFLLSGYSLIKLIIILISFGEDPYLKSLKKLADFELKIGSKATYFVGTWGKNDNNSDERDLHYNYLNKKLNKTVRWLKNKGFDIGLHNSIGAWNYKRYHKEVIRFKNIFGFLPEGYRGHYWSGSFPDATNAMSMAFSTCGFKYSSTLGLNLLHGFRRGICYPYRPFNINTGKFAGLLELPPIMMDYSLLLDGKSNDERIEAFKKRTKSIKENNGLFVIDWHSDSLSNGYMDNMTDPLLDEIEKIASDKSCWITSLSEIANWCDNIRWTSAGD